MVVVELVAHEPELDRQPGGGDPVPHLLLDEAPVVVAGVHAVAGHHDDAVDLLGVLRERLREVGDGLHHPAQQRRPPGRRRRAHRVPDLVAVALAEVDQPRRVVLRAALPAEPAQRDGVVVAGVAQRLAPSVRGAGSRPRAPPHPSVPTMIDPTAANPSARLRPGGGAFGGNARQGRAASTIAVSSACVSGHDSGGPDA
ncbi:hypothetical protein [Saccharothrix lopnurensis]|uniref:Uncharacterized protein n=1 Tax=Saccharothrix lopnurensis TaxID=1670621 RepID=A0ABW1PD44_9PSEU